MFQTAMIINIFRLLENSLEIIVIEKFYEFLSRTFLLVCIVSSRKDRGSARRSRLIFLESVIARAAEGKLALKRICSPREERLKSL